MQQNDFGRTPIFRDYKAIPQLFDSGACFVAFDTETTGLSSQNDYLTEIGAVKFNCHGEISSFDQLIKPPVPIPFFIENITHITNSLVKDCPPAEKALVDFISFLGDENVVLVAHNAPFDLGFINVLLHKMGFGPLPNLTIDSLPLSRWLHPEFRNQCVDGPYRLQSLAQRFNIEVKSAHRADDDSRVLKEIFLRLVEDSRTK